MDEITEKVTQLLRTHLRWVDETQALDLNADLMCLGLDSMSSIDLLLGLEQTFDITFADDFIDPEHFRTGAILTDTIQQIVVAQQKRNERAAERTDS